ncbi:MAG: sugar ABC transporter substrate-binding protein, partial [Micrococcales bacterium]|nr:sugar ABC transporter substrate-binding protein [Micrococcales bacterium]
TTYDEFATAATAYHKANPHGVLASIASSQPGQWMGLFWQAGAQPFTYDGKQTVSINLTSDAVKKVIDYWQPLIQSGAVGTEPDFTDQWNGHLNDGSIAGMLTAAWMPGYVAGAATNTSGQWRVAPLPQWDASNPASGNWGGSTYAAMASTKYPIAAAELVRFINQDSACAALQWQGQQVASGLLIPMTRDLDNPEFLAATSPFFGGQQVNQVFAQIAPTVNTNFQWPPFIDYVYSSFNDTLGKAIANSGDMEAGLTAWQNAVVQYAQQQGFTVTQ